MRLILAGEFRAGFLGNIIGTCSIGRRLATLPIRYRVPVYRANMASFHGLDLEDTRGPNCSASKERTDNQLQN